MPSSAPPPQSPRRRFPYPPRVFARLGAIALIIGALALAFAWTAGWLTPSRLSSADVADVLERHNGEHPGFRRAHEKGVCVVGYFDSNGRGQALSKAVVFAPGRTPVFGRFALAVGSPYAPDGVPAPRSLALNFSAADGSTWRTAMNSVPLFPVGNVRDFVALQRATTPDPATGKPDPAKVAAFMAAHPETRAFNALIASRPIPSSFANGGYHSINAFRFIDADGTVRAVRWSMLPEAAFSALDRGRFDAMNARDRDFLFNDLFARLRQEPQRWHLVVTLAAAGDRTDNATVQWPAARERIDVGTLVIERALPEPAGPCRDVTFDPLVLPPGIAASDDPLLSARSAVYAASLRRRSGEGPYPGAPDGAPAPTAPESQR
ncbi:catalase family peroxidase [Luteimonas sp. 22616]|uniref:catalase family peroxidase n=1 Tax=Luteimonas sp. 22616 TaxID=3453951 RepID=UPI003F879EA1